MGDDRGLDRAEAIYIRYFDTLGRAAERVAAEAERARREPPDPVRVIRLLGQFTVLGRLLDGGMLPLDVIATFFPPTGASPASDLAAPLGAGVTALEVGTAEFEAALQGVIEHLSRRYGIQIADEPAA